MSGRKGDAEPLAIERQHVKALVEWLGLSRHGEIELALQQQFRQPRRHALDESDFASRIGAAEMGEKTHKAGWADRAHDTQADLGFLQAEKPLRRRFRGIGIGEELAQMRL